jgi:hypothetical protein
MKLAWRHASHEDIDFLVDWNHQLIRDDFHRNSMTVPELRARMKGWFDANEYQAVLFSDTEPVAHALFRTDKDMVYLRQFFVRRDRRRAGIGRAAFGILRNEVWPKSHRVVVDALCRENGTIPFWRAVGCRDYCMTLEIMPA